MVIIREKYFFLKLVPFLKHGVITFVRGGKLVENGGKEKAHSAQCFGYHIPFYHKTFVATSNCLSTYKHSHESVQYWLFWVNHRSIYL